MTAISGFQLIKDPSKMVGHYGNVPETPKNYERRMGQALARIRSGLPNVRVTVVSPR